MNTIKNNNYKKQICLYWKNGKCNKDKKNCFYAHGENDIIKEECQNGIKCYNEYCRFSHPDEWNAFDNKKECDFCIKGFCNKENKKFKHIDIKCDIKDKKDKNFIFNENDFPSLKSLNKKAKNDDDKNILHINKDIKDINELNSLKKELYKNYKGLTSISDWSDDLEIDNNIKDLNRKYNELKQKINKQNEDVFNNDLDLNIFDIDSDIKNDELEYKINGVNIKGKYNNEIKQEDEKQKDFNENKILKLLNEMENINNEYVSNIKKIIFNNKEYKIFKEENMILFIKQLNNIMSDIYLLKTNYQDLFNCKS